MEVRGHQKKMRIWEQRCTDSFSECLSVAIIAGAMIMIMIALL